MSSYLNSQQFVRVAAVAFVAIAAAVAVTKSRRGENAAVLTPLEPAEADALVHELARCRTVTPDEAIVLEACRRLWAENRQRFFVSAKSPNLSDLPASTEVTKSQERIPQHEIEPTGSR